MRPASPPTPPIGSCVSACIPRREPSELARGGSLPPDSSRSLSAPAGPCPQGSHLTTWVGEQLVHSTTHC